MPKTYSGLVNLNGNVLAAMDFETTGRRAGYHEIIQVAIVPLNSDLRPMEGIRPFYHTMKPVHSERQEKTAGFVHQLDIDDLILHAPTSGQVETFLIEWFERLDLPFGKRLVPLAHNISFEMKFLEAWLKVELKDEIFHHAGRCSMGYAVSLNDRAAFAGQKEPFNRVGLKSLCRYFGVHNTNPHDALADALAEAEVYRCMLRMP